MTDVMSFEENFLKLIIQVVTIDSAISWLSSPSLLVTIVLCLKRFAMWNDPKGQSGSLELALYDTVSVILHVWRFVCDVVQLFSLDLKFYSTCDFLFLIHTLASSMVWFVWDVALRQLSLNLLFSTTQSHWEWHHSKLCPKNIPLFYHL